MLDVGLKDSDTEYCAGVDAALATFKAEAIGHAAKFAAKAGPLLNPALFKGSLLAALKTCDLYPGLLALPGLMEATRKHLCQAPPTGVDKFLIELAEDIDRCTDARTLRILRLLLAYIQLTFHRLPTTFHLLLAATTHLPPISYHLQLAAC